MIKSFYFGEHLAFSVNCEKCACYCPVVLDSQKHGVKHCITESIEEEKICLDSMLVDFRYKDTLKNLCQNCMQKVSR